MSILTVSLRYRHLVWVGLCRRSSLHPGWETTVLDPEGGPLCALPVPFTARVSVPRSPLDCAFLRVSQSWGHPARALAAVGALDGWPKELSVSSSRGLRTPSPWRLGTPPGHGSQDPLVCAAPKVALAPDSREAEGDPAWSVSVPFLTAAGLCPVVISSLVWKNRRCTGQTSPFQLSSLSATSAPCLFIVTLPLCCCLFLSEMNHRPLSSAWALGLRSVSDLDIGPTVVDMLPRRWWCFLSVRKNRVHLAT